MTTPPSTTPALQSAPGQSAGPSSGAGDTSSASGLSPPGGQLQHPGEAGAAAPARSRWRWLWIGLLALLVLLLAGLAGSAWWAWRHPAALPWVLQHVPGLQATGVTGSLASGRLQIARLDWQLPAQAGRLRLSQLDIDGTRVVLWPRPGAQAMVQVGRLQAERVQYDSPPPSGQPLQAPPHLRLPIDLTVQQLIIDRLQIDALPPVRQLRAAVALGANGGSQHRVDGLQLELDTGTAAAPAPVQLAGQLQIGTAAPLAVQARLQASSPGLLPTAATGSAPPQRQVAPPWRATLSAQGPLAALQAELQLIGDGRAGTTPPQLQARATVRPFAAWPLGMLQLQTAGLNLAALSPRLPQTRLAGRADLQTLGRDQPAALSATLDNSLAGAWDTGRLPLRQLQLQASGRPDQTDRLNLDRFTLLLGDAAGAAGRISGQGSWRGDALSLQLQIDQLLPARLHGSAAPLRLSGPLAVRARGLPSDAATTTASPPPASVAPPTVAVDGTLTGQWADGSGLPMQLRLVGEASARRLLVTQAEARTGSALAKASGLAQAEGGGWRLQGQATLADFDPRPWWRGPEGSAWRRGPHRLQGEVSANLLWRPTQAARAGDLAIDRLLAALDGDARLRLADSQLAGVPLVADIALQSQGPSAQVQGTLTLGGNRLTLDGQGGADAAADRWQATLQAPTLATLAPLRALVDELAPDSAAAIDRAWPTSGNLQATLQTQGRWPAQQSQGTLQASQLACAAFQLQQASLSWRQGDRTDAPLQLNLQAQVIRSAGQQLDGLALTLNGTLADHAIRLSADSPLRPPAWTENLLGPAGNGTRLVGEARGQWAPGAAGAGGRYRLQGLGLNGGARQVPPDTSPWLSAQGLAGTLQLDTNGSLQSVQLAPGRVQLPGTALNWRTLSWTAGGSLVVAAELETIDVARLLSRLQPDMGWRGDLTLGGRIDITSTAQTLDADIVLARGGGDLSVVDDMGQAQPLGLSELRLALSTQGGRWQFAQGLVGARIGSLVGAQVLTNPPGQRWPQPGAALQGLVEARVANLGVWGTWVPPGWRLSGALDTVAQFDGTLAAPRITGSMRGSGLGLRNVLEGVNLTDGQLDLQLTGDQARIERFSFQGGAGRLDITGGAELGTQPRVTLQLVADQFRVLGRIDRRVVASGQAGVTLRDRRLQIDGGFTVDEGFIDIGRGDAPTLDSDVRVQRSAGVASAAAAELAATAPAHGVGATPAQAPAQVQVRVKINLGPNLQLRGQGVDTRLGGDVVLTSLGGKLAVTGSVSTVNGRYAAYGQRLDITRGRFVFNGDPGNPRIDVLAIRPNLDVQVGVLVDGQAQNPRIRLYSDPELADYDKLSWLVLGRSPDGLGSADTALLQRAAFALLSGSGTGPTDKLLEAIGLTDFSFRQTEGDTRDTIISLGKQLSSRWYVGYERGVQATTGTWQLIYRVAQRFTLRAQSGSESAIDMIWTWRW
jgi:translocation and assembly module TamB